MHRRRASFACRFSLRAGPPATAPAGGLPIHVLDGLRYILDRATSLAPPRGVPVVVNLSFGHIAGPHDGSSMLERAIHELIEAYRRAARLEVVVAAGNSLLSRCHAGFSLGPNDSKDAGLARYCPTTRRRALWRSGFGRRGGRRRMSRWRSRLLGVTRTRRSARAGSYVHTWRLDGEVLGAIIRLRRVATGDREMILLAVAPTQRLGRDEKVAPCGTWSVRISNCGTAAGRYRSLHRARRDALWVPPSRSPVPFRRSQLRALRQVRSPQGGRCEGGSRAETSRKLHQARRHHQLDCHGRAHGSRSGLPR